MVRMKCIKAFTYAGRKLKPNDPFDARGSDDARILSAIGKAVRVTANVFAPAKILPAVVAVAAPAVIVPEVSIEKVAAEEIAAEGGEEIVQSAEDENTLQENAETPAAPVIQEAKKLEIVKTHTRRRNQSGAGKK